MKNKFAILLLVPIILLLTGAAPPKYATTATFTNNFSFNSDQFTLTGVNGTNVALKNGIQTTNDNAFSSTTTTVPRKITLAGGHNTNAVSVLQGPAIVSGFDSNGVAFHSISNATVNYQAFYRVFNQVQQSTCTNISTVETTWLGSGDGSLTLPAGFWSVYRSLVGQIKGTMWTGASPGNCAIRLKLGSTQIATNVPTSVQASLTATEFTMDFQLTIRTNSSIGFIYAQGVFNMLTTTEGSTDTPRTMKSTLPIFDTTAAMALDLASTNGATTDSFRVNEALVYAIPR